MKANLTFFLFMVAVAVYGQSKSLVEARTLQAEGKYEKALALADQLVKSEGAEDGGAWYTYAEISRTLYQQTQDFKLRSAYLASAVRGYHKTLEYQAPGTRIYLSAGQSLGKMHQDLIQTGVQFYRDGSYDQALEAFENAVIIIPQDSTVLTYAANAAVQGKHYDKALNNYRKLILLKPKESIYQNMISIQRDLQKDLEGALTTIREARETFPGVDSFGRYELDILLLSKQNNKALMLLDELLREDPDDIPMNLRRAVLLDEQAKTLKASGDSTPFKQAERATELAYLKTIALSPDNLVANFNLAMFYNDQANTYYHAINTMSNDEYQANAKTYEEKALELIGKALPLMENASRKSPKDLNILKALEVYYDRLSMGDEKRAIQARIKALSN